MLLNDAWQNCEGHMMDVGMHVDSLHSTHIPGFHVWERGDVLHGLRTQLCKYSLDPSQTLARESGYA